MFIIKVITDFSSAHSLKNYPGDCSRFHGHNWDVEISIYSKILNKIGMAIDFREIKKKAKSITKRLDHRYLNDIKPFDKINPTAENIAKYIFEEVAALIDNNNVKIQQVTIWENKTSSATYTKYNNLPL